MNREGKLQRIYDSIVDFVSKRQSQFLYLELFQYGIYAIIYLIAWVNPSTFSPEFILTLVLLIVFEFVMVHSGLFMSLGKYAPLVFLPFYSIFAFAFNVIVPDNTILYLYTFTIINRLLLGFNINNRKGDHPMIRAFFRCFVSYFPVFIGSILFSSIIPDFGLTTEMQSFINDSADHKSQGNITMKMMITCGFFYYLMLPFWEMYISRKNKEAINILFVSSNEIGSIVKPRLSTFWDYVYQTNNIENVDLENFDKGYDFVIKKAKPFLGDIRDDLELIIITEKSESVDRLKAYLDSNNLSHIPIIDFSEVIVPIKEEILDAYKQLIPENFQIIPNNEHPISNSIVKHIFDNLIAPQLILNLKNDTLLSPLNVSLFNRFIKRLHRIKVYQAYE